MPVFPFGMVDKDGAFSPVKVVVEVDVSLDFMEVREHLLKAPLIIAHGGPGVEVLGYPPIESRGVDGAGPSSDLASGNRHRWRQVGGPGNELPVVGAGQKGYWMAGRSPQGCAGTGVKAKLEFIGQALKFWVIGPGLQEEHGPSGV